MDSEETRDGIERKGMERDTSSESSELGAPLAETAVRAE